MSTLHNIKGPPWTNTPADVLILRRPDPLLARAQRNYPDSEWLRAIAVVRNTRIGWRLDRPFTKGQANA